MRAAIYVRQSIDRSGEAVAVTRQRTECAALAERHGWSVGEVYEDNDASASSGKARVAWRRLLRDLHDGRYDVLVCWHTDRLARTLRDLADLMDAAEKHNLRIAAVQAGDLDLSTPSGRMVATMLGGAARFEVEQKADRQRAANKQRAQSGVMLWTRRPFGFDRDGREVRVVETEAAELVKAVDALLGGSTLTAVAADLNRRGVVTTLGNRWTIKTLKQAVLNPRLTGRVMYAGQDYGTHGPRVINDETYDRLKALLTDPRRKNAPSTAVKYLLSGIVRCGRCGDDPEAEAMLATTNGAERLHVYRCRRCYLTRQRERVDQRVLGAVVARLAAPDAAEVFQPDVDLAGLRGQLVELRDRRDGVAELLSDGLLSREAARTQAKRLTVQISDLERQIDAATGASPVVELAEAGDEDEIAAALLSLPIARQREVIRSLCDVTILPAGKGARWSPDQVAITWRGSGT